MTPENRSRPKHKVLLATALVLIKDSSGISHPCRALVDSGSQDHFISEKLAERMKLKTHATSVPLHGINNTTSSANCFVTTEMSSMVENYKRSLDFLVVKKVAGNLPAFTIDTNQWRIPAGLQLADPHFHESSSVDLLIGAENFLEMLKHGRATLAEDLPMLQNTRLGWIASGKFAIATEKATETSTPKSKRTFWPLNQESHSTSPRFDWNLMHRYLPENKQITKAASLLRHNCGIPYSTVGENVRLQVSVA